MATNPGSANNSPANKNNLSPNSGSVPRFRASVDAHKTLAGAANYNAGQMSAGLGGFGGLPTPGLGQTRLRPSSDMMMGGHGSVTHTPETEAIDKWFEDLQHYEATLEEMAAASLDQNFKEELSAIEQWFRVLSEAERTAALYSLLQSSTQVQIRFFITVLQQMARADPMSALLSPANPQGASMEAQMEAKLANSGRKPPTSPAVRQFGRQSLGGPEFLSPNSAALHDGNDAASLLAQQRAKLKAQANRISAPGQLHGTAGGDAHKSPLWSQANSEQVAESSPARSPSPNPRPRSTSSDIGANPNPAGNVVTLPRQPAFGDQFTPLVGGGNWASMVSTPLVPMFGSKTEGGDAENPGFSGTQPNLDAATQKLNNWSGGPNSSPGGSGIVLDDARKFRRNAKVSAGVGAGRPGEGQDPSTGGVQGVLSGMYKDNRRVSASNAPGSDRSTSPAPPNMLNSQQAAMTAQQNWRNGLISPTSATSSSSQDNLNVLAMANLFNMQQQQIQLQQNLLALGMPNAMTMGMGMQSPLAVANGMSNMGMLQNQMLSPGGMGMGGMGVGMGNMGNSGMGMAGSMAQQQRRSPRPGDRSTSGTKSHPPPVPGSGSNPDEAVDMTLLSDVPAWLRSLRLHKYTSNFENVDWKDMVLMDDAALEAKGVTALGARRKMLKVFETVREKMGMQLPGDGAPAEGATAEATTPDA